MSTKYPIILVHGIMIKDLWHFRAFGKIEHILKHEGHRVYTSNHDGLGTIEHNAEQILDYIDKVLEKEKCEKVNIIAHSKGGLDSLYMIDRLGASSKIASLTFLCTPHKGSIIATKLYELPKFFRNFLAFWLNFWFKIFGDKKPNALGVCYELMSTPDSIIETFDHHDGIYMQSYSTELEKSKHDFVMGIPLIFSRRYEDYPSDGLVSVESSKFRNYKGHCTNSSVSHSEIVDFFVRKTKRNIIYNFYRVLCSDLENRGY